MDIYVDSAKKCRGKQSLYFSVPKDIELYDLDCIHPKYYDATKKMFETSPSNFSILLNKFISEDIRILNELPKQLDKELTRLETFDNMWNPQYKTKPFDYQAKGVVYGHSAPKFLLGDQMGLRTR